MIQTKLSFTNKKLKLIIPNDECDMQLNKSKTQKCLIKKESDKPKPLPDSYKPPTDLNQYETLDLTSYYDIGNKLNYLPLMISKIRDKQISKGLKFNEELYQSYYSILDVPQSRVLINLFKRDIPPHTKYYKRLADEFHLINERNFTKVFLQVMDILAISDKLGIPHIIRGSAGSSLVCYLLRITDIDPILEEISLARFMHTRRKDLPDIDIDFPNNTRHLIYQEIFTKYGNRVARISNHVAYSMKTAIKDTMRQHGYRRFLPKDFEIEDYIDDYQEIEEIQREAEQLDGTFKQYSLHCGGIIIFDKPIPDEYLLNIREMVEAPSIKWQQSLLNKDQVDDYQFIKIDILSNRGLAELWDIDKRPIDTYFQKPLDADVLQLLARGGNIGIVYAESRAMYKAFVCLQPSCLGDIALGLAIIRPVARELKNAYFKDYADYQSIKDDIENCKGLRDKLGNYIIYDDDAIQYIQRLVKCSEADADIYRKVFAKSKWKEMHDFAIMLQKIRHDLSSEQRQLIYDQLCNLSAYSFCKSHAISYAKLVYCLAYHKYHNPRQFWLAALNNCNSSYRRWVYYREAVVVGISLSMGYKPWKLDTNYVLISTSSRKIPIELSHITDTLISDINSNKIRQYFILGYWTSVKFLDGCYFETSTEEVKKDDGTLVNITTAKFCGLIANYRICKMRKKHGKDKSNKLGNPIRKDRSVTFVTIGYDNACYIDVVLYGKICLGKCHIIEGHGVLMDIGRAEWIQVKKWKSKWLE